jgi:hypothetical protein
MNPIIDVAVKGALNRTWPITIPISVSVPEQVLPVSFMLRAQLTDPTLRFERDGLEVSTLHFGSCPLNASRILELSIRNVSALPQRFGFLPLPKELDVQPGDAIGTILPGETLVRRVLFSPTAEITHKITLTCRTSLNRTYHLKCVGTGIQPILTLSSVKLSLPPTVEGDTSFGDVTLTNSSKHEARTFEFAPPVGSCLKLAPKVGTLPPGESVRVRIEFTAPVNPDTSYAPHGRSGAGVPVVTEGEEGGEEGGEDKDNEDEGNGEEDEGEEEGKVSGKTVRKYVSTNTPTKTEERGKVNTPRVNSSTEEATKAAENSMIDNCLMRDCLQTLIYFSS